MGRFDGKSTLITGAASGMGRACAVLFAAEGASVFAIDVNEAGLAETAQRITRDGGKVQTARVDLRTRAACRDAVSSVESSARKKDIKLLLIASDDAVIAPVSARALDHVVINLVDNAVKYSAAKNEVHIRVLPSSEHVAIEVQDWGAGIPAKYQDRIFERFYRVDKGRSREEGGTGLGLAIVRHLVNRMGGSIEVESEPEKGSLFRVLLPLDLVSDVEI